MEGSLSKWTNVMKGWQYRWFVLDETAGLLSYYTSREKMTRGVRRGCVRLSGAVIGIDDEDQTTFTITVDGKTFHFQARNFDEREKWIRALEDTTVRHAYGCHSSISSATRGKIRSNPQLLQNFEKKIAEADAYLQLMIEQTQALETRRAELSNEEHKKVITEILNTTNIMLEQVKHTIVLLQIAKNSAFPINGTYRPMKIQSDSLPSTSSAFSNNESVKEDEIEEASECDEASMMPNLTMISNFNEGIPDISYSSSDDEDFYDACDSEGASINVAEDSASDDSSPITIDNNNSHVHGTMDNSKSDGTTPSISTNDSCTTSVEDVYAKSTSVKSYSSGVPVLSDGSIDFDALYEDPSENDLSVESQGSVVKHMISQVKIGMDLTKVVLPTFILERRSLLEMYADYFAHPDIFLKAADLETPKERMVQIVKWYLSSYHAGRKSSVAKKPYNPILGEVFRCWWDVNGIVENSNTSSPNISTNSEGPVPWCAQDQLVFIAEQVSHHPPISAFYAEHVNKQVSLCAHVWTKSKFLGLSIGVHNIGCGTVKLIRHNERYISTFPNGYGRSILTVPWIELGGSTTIKCPETGYYCNVEFLTKPFYGGKKHRITAEVFEPINERKPFLTISGEWNGAMEAKWADGRSEIFVDTRKLNVIKKKVKKIDEQAENESRKIWKYVTLGLKYNDVDQATSAKMKIEQKQREEALARKENNEAWQSKYFYEDNGSWYYRNPLENRLTGQSD